MKKEIQNMISYDNHVTKLHQTPFPFTQSQIQQIGRQRWNL